MRKVTMLVVISVCIFLFSSLTVVASSGNSVFNDSDDHMERQMLNSIEYIEEYEEVNLDFDPYFHLPLNFNAYEGMELDINTIEYIEIEEELD